MPTAANATKDHDRWGSPELDHPQAHERLANRAPGPDRHNIHVT
jgi:hypothetical protein